MTLHQELEAAHARQQASSAQRDREMERLERELSISLACHVAEVKVLKDAGEESKARLAVLEVQCAEKTDTIASRDKALAACREETQLLYDGKAALEREVKSLQGRLEQAHKDTREAAEAAQRTQQALAARDLEICAGNAALSELQKRVADGAVVLAALESKCSDLQAALASSQVCIVYWN